MANIYLAEVTETTDGDTVKGHLILEDFDEVKKHQKFRFTIVDTPERGEPGYYEAKEWTAQQCDGKTLRVVLHGKDNWNRWIADIYIVVDGVETSISSELLRLGLGVPYIKGK
jgi:micrococcal nuclease